MTTEIEKIEIAGFMDDDVDVVESRGPQSVSLQSGDINFSRLSREPLQQPVAQADPYGRVTTASGLPIVPEGRGGNASLTEAMEVALRARSRQEGPPTSKKETLQEARSTGRAPLSGNGRRIMKKTGKRPLREVKTGGVQTGDIVEHKKFGCLGRVVDASKEGMVVDLQGIGIVEVTRQTAPLYKLVGKGTG